MVSHGFGLDCAVHLDLALFAIRVSIESHRHHNSLSILHCQVFPVFQYYPEARPAQPRRKSLSDAGTRPRLLPLTVLFFFPLSFFTAFSFGFILGLEISFLILPLHSSFSSTFSVLTIDSRLPWDHPGTLPFSFPSFQLHPPLGFSILRFLWCSNSSCHRPSRSPTETGLRVVVTGVSLWVVRAFLSSFFPLDLPLVKDCDLATWPNTSRKRRVPGQYSLASSLDC